MMDMNEARYEQDKNSGKWHAIVPSVNSRRGLAPADEVERLGPADTKAAIRNKVAEYAYDMIHTPISTPDQTEEEHLLAAPPPPGVTVS